MPILLLKPQEVKQARRIANLSVSELAELAGLSTREICYIERGERANPKWGTMLALTRAIEAVAPLAMARLLSENILG